MNPNLFKAILAMDSYNRGYGADITIDGSKLGNSEIIKTSLSLGTMTVAGKTIGLDEHIGFYGIAYKLASGEKVISYRGTDELAGDGDVGSDAWYGYGVGTWTAEGKQAELAFKFYQSVAGAVDPRLANISLTGHSLGGGLAGLVGENDNFNITKSQVM